jgi:uncharacterized repeat protein (TIGR03803 family)
LNPTTNTETAVYSFQGGTDGSFPVAGLIRDDGILYGTTEYGGAGAGGTVFSLNPTTDAETLLYSFCSQQNCADGAGPSAGLIRVGDTLYGTTYNGGANGMGTVFSINHSSGAEAVVYSFQGSTDGANPVAGLINVGGTLYGTTMGGGTGTCNGGCGTVFEITLP